MRRSTGEFIGQVEVGFIAIHDWLLACLDGKVLLRRMREVQAGEVRLQGTKFLNSIQQPHTIDERCTTASDSIQRSTVCKQVQAQD